MKYLSKEFESLSIEFITSYTNFITTVWENSNVAENIVDKLLERGIIVRKLSSFGWENCIRITIGTSKENAILIKVLKSII